MIFLGDTKKQGSPWGYTHPDKDIESMCQWCKNEDTIRLRGDDGLRIKDFFNDIKKSLNHENFRAYYCQMCGAYWWHKTI